MMAAIRRKIKDDGFLELIRKVRENHNGLINCTDLLRVNAENGGEKMPHCNAMIRECVGYVEEILKEKGKL